MDGRLLREIGWNGKIIIKKGNSKKVSNNDPIRTYAIKCEHILNSRPLVYIDGNIRSTEAIMPNCFL